MSDSNVVGHKTFWSKERGFWHEPLHADEADRIFAEFEASNRRKNELMPDEESAIRMLFDAYQRLSDFGWRDAIYCPKDGSTFLVIEAGSTGRHECTYQGAWPDGHWWIVSDGDMSPSRPVLFKPISGAAEGGA